LRLTLSLPAAEVTEAEVMQAMVAADTLAMAAVTGHGGRGYGGGYGGAYGGYYGPAYGFGGCLPVPVPIVGCW